MQKMSSNVSLNHSEELSRYGILTTKAAAKRAAVWAHQAADVRLTCEVVARVYNILPEALCASTRGEAHVAQARQIAMYLAHITFGLSLGAVGRHFGRDRTTAAYACERVEDRRDDLRLDLMLDRLERALSILSSARSGRASKIQ